MVETDVSHDAFGGCQRGGGTWSGRDADVAQMSVLRKRVETNPSRISYSSHDHGDPTRVVPLRVRESPVH